ncbi:hypothetical protein BC739_003144 [Kutzneria viridogrisea]|uniref:DUF5047 domain-containing protein n=1 Tax=Kutzneria viridogrisea TaxID=47990 RepID=A0ABR6BGE8_9PSEU|nr:hypothetical protein [Kutzneria viridogrisea]
MVTGLPLTGGTVTADATSQVRRTASVTFADPTYWPASPTDVLSPLGSELLIEYGITIPSVGTEWIPLITGVVTDVSRTIPFGGSGIQVTLADRSSKVAEDKLTSPAQVGGGTTTVVQAITSLVQHLYPSVTVLDQTGDATVAPVLDIQQDRWADGCEKFADSIGAEVYFDQRGRLVVRPQPTLAGPGVWQVSTGARGVLVGKNERKTRSDVYNQVIASGMRTDGTSPVYVIVSDLDPSSPTYYGGPFGIKPRRYTNSLLTTTAQATTAATALLERARGLQASVTLSALANPALEPGDVIKVSTSGAPQAHIIDQVVTALDPGTAQQITTRSKQLPAES